MHQALEVWIPDTTDIDSEKAVAEAVESTVYGCNGLMDCDCCGGGDYDWYLVGGYFVDLKGHDTASDQRNWEPCPTCQGSGDRLGWVVYDEDGTRRFSGVGPAAMFGGDEERGRRWAEKCNGCNSCDGTGKHRRLYDAYHPSVCSPTSDKLPYSDDHTLYVYDGETYYGEPPEDVDNGYWVTVDFHS